MFIHFIQGISSVDFLVWYFLNCCKNIKTTGCEELYLPNPNSVL